LLGLVDSVEKYVENFLGEGILVGFCWGDLGVEN
jgi:hypothetical protein